MGGIKTECNKALWFLKQVCNYLLMPNTFVHFSSLVEAYPFSKQPLSEKYIVGTILLRNANAESFQTVSRVLLRG